VTVSVTDALHQSANTTVTFSATGPSTPPGVVGGTTVAEIGVLLVVLVLAAGLLVLWIRRRRPPRARSESPVGTG
jgi:uncharacterized membrane protein